MENYRFICLSVFPYKGYVFLAFKPLPHTNIYIGVLGELRRKERFAHMCKCILVQMATFPEAENIDMPK